MGTVLEGEAASLRDEIADLRRQLEEAKALYEQAIQREERNVAALQAENERLTPQFTGKPDEAALNKVKAKCTQYWNESATLCPDEMHKVLEFIYNHACDAERRHDALREALKSIAAHEPPVDPLPPEFINRECAECEANSKKRWPPSGLCNEHYSMQARNLDANAAHRASQHLSMRALARAALDGGKGE